MDVYLRWKAVNTKLAADRQFSYLFIKKSLMTLISSSIIFDCGDRQRHFLNDHDEFCHVGALTDTYGIWVSTDEVGGRWQMLSLRVVVAFAVAATSQSLLLSPSTLVPLSRSLSLSLTHVVVVAVRRSRFHRCRHRRRNTTSMYVTYSLYTSKWLYKWGVLDSYVNATMHVLYSFYTKCTFCIVWL